MPLGLGLDLKIGIVWDRLRLTKLPLFVILLNTLKNWFFSGNKTVSGCKLEKHVFMINFFLNFLAFSVFYAKNKNAYFDPSLKCAAPKPWSKYTTFNPTKNGLNLKFGRSNILSIMFPEQFLIVLVTLTFFVILLQPWYHLYR